MSRSSFTAWMRRCTPSGLAAVRRQKLWEMLQAQQLHYTRFRMLDFITETDFMRIIGEHEESVPPDCG